MKIICMSVILLATVHCIAQIRQEKIVLNSGESLKIENEGDIIVADTIILMEASSIILNPNKKENYIHAGVLIVQGKASIIGRGKSGKDGNPGVNGKTFDGPCRKGTNGTDGLEGLDGGSGTDLYLYSGKIIIRDKLTIDLSGGNGGKGGDGGNGGGGSPGTVHCLGGDGGKGGNGGRGGNGGNSGNLFLIQQSKDVSQDDLTRKIQVVLEGGLPGRGGRGGYSGSAGLGPGQKKGVDGKAGLFGSNGITGKVGSLKIEPNP